MNKFYTLRSAVAIGLLAATGLVSAADKAPAGDAPSAKHAPYHRHDPVKHTQVRLDRLEAKLNLNDSQRGAWQAYSEATLARAKDRSARIEDFRGKHGAPRQALDTASKLDKAAERMRARADELQKVAQETRALQQALTPEQQTIFDLYWQSQKRPGRMGGHGHRPA